MAKKQNERLLWPLPDTDGPFEYTPVCIPIPNDPQHRQNFLGALLALSRWFNYTRTDDNRGKIAADAWLYTFDEAVVSVSSGNPCCDAPLYRRAGSYLERSDDGGTTWERVPDGPTEWPPDEGPIQPEPELPEGTDKKCVYAASAAAVYREMHKQMSPYFTVGGVIGIIITSVVNSFAWIFGQTEAGWDATRDVFELAHSAATGGTTAASFTPAIQKELQCIFYDWMQEDGTLPTESFAGVLADIALKTGEIWTLIHIYVEGFGNVGATNAGHSANQPAADCDCPEECGPCGVVALRTYTRLTPPSPLPAVGPNLGGNSMFLEWPNEYVFPLTDTRCFNRVRLQIRTQTSTGSRAQHIQVWLDGLFLGEIIHPTTTAGGNIGFHGFDLGYQIRGENLTLKSQEAGKVTEISYLELQYCNG